MNETQKNLIDPMGLFCARQQGSEIKNFSFQKAFFNAL